MKYGSEFGAFKITSTMFYAGFLVIESIEKCSDYPFTLYLTLKMLIFYST